jgi:hypothetical protein
VDPAAVSVTEIKATFNSGPEVGSAVAALRAAGIPESAIEVREGELPPVRQREGRYLWRLLVLIVLWSVLGGVIGVLTGLVLAATIGPEGTTGLVFQVVCWAIIGHLVFGMVAGYVVLADRSHPEMEPERPQVVVTVRVAPAELEGTHAALRAAGARRLTVTRGASPTYRR